MSVFKDESVTISAGNTGTTNSRYWMLTQNNGFDIPVRDPNVLHYFHQKKTNEVQDGVLYDIFNKIIAALKEVTRNDFTYEYHIPGFIQTISVTHQKLHLDDKITNLDQDEEAFILHIPMDVEGMQLRMGKVHQKSDQQSAKLEHKLVHIPFGSGVLIPVTQLHAGHYGKENNFRFHAVISNKPWPGNKLLLLEEYLDKMCTHEEKQEILDKYDKELENQSPTLMEPASASQKRIKTTYIDNLKKYYTYPGFIKLLQE